MPAAFLTFDLFNFIISIVGSIIASIVFLYIVLIYYRPRLEISPNMIQMPDFDNPRGKAFLFKILNKSKHPAFDVRMEICLMKKLTVKKGQMDTRRTKLTLKRDSVACIPKYIKTRKIYNFAPHAILVRSVDPIDEFLSNEDNCVEIQVSARHGLTSLGKVFTEEFSKSSIKTGKFKFGNFLDTE